MDLDQVNLLEIILWAWHQVKPDELAYWGVQLSSEGWRGCCVQVNCLLLVVKMLLGDNNAETTRTSEIREKFHQKYLELFPTYLHNIKMFHRFILLNHRLYNLKPLIPCIAEELSMIGHISETPWNCVFSKKFPLRSWFLNSSKSKLTEASNQSPKGRLYVYVEPAMC